jgi:hypothetical protein
MEGTVVVDTSRTKPFVLTVDDEEHITELVAMASMSNAPLPAVRHWPRSTNDGPI